MFDAVRIASPLAARRSRILETLGVRRNCYGVATFHRQESLDSKPRTEAIVTYLRKQSEEQPLIVPLHPRTRSVLHNYGIDLGSSTIVTTEPLGYLDMCELVRSAKVILTDSGGLQREAYFHRVLCVTLRDETEWVETIASGWNRLWSVPDYEPRREIADYESASAAEAIFAVLDETLPSQAASL